MPQVKLVPTLQVGFSGHRALLDEALCRSAILKVLSELKADWAEGISGISSLAAGGDLLFAEACFELGIPLRVVMPMQPDQFKSDFDPADWSRVENALKKSACFEVVDGGSPPPECYYECGLEMVHHCGLLIALWNGLPARGTGGTAEMVRYCEELGHPILCIHSETGEFVRLNEDHLKLKDSDLAWFNELPDFGVEPTSAPEQQALAWLTKLDRNALKVAPQFQRIVSIPILCTGIGSILTAAADIFEPVASFLLAGSAFLGITAFFAPKILKAKQRQERRALIRCAAEISRSFVALWNAPVSYELISKAEVAECNGMINSLNHLKLISSFRSRQEDIAPFKADYQESRINDQAIYFSFQAQRASRVMLRATRVIRGSIFLSVAGNLLVMSSKIFHMPPPGAWTSEFGLAIALALQIAAGIGAIIVINDYGRRQLRYLEMRTLILDYGKQLQQAKSWPSVLRLVILIEKALLVEVMEWRTLFKNQKFGK